DPSLPGVFAFAGRLSRRSSRHATPSGTPASAGRRALPGAFGVARRSRPGGADCRVGQGVSARGGAAVGGPARQDPLSEYPAPDPQRAELDGAGGATARLGGSGAFGPGPYGGSGPRRRREDAAGEPQAGFGGEPPALGGGARDRDHALARGDLSQDE